ncbi:rubrerythrin family protein [Anaeromyxobacter sp. PSR-1]|uniref:rubrerythrin family protein n=1 Tax=unclassified Anaeromyxobacter TaxID=2620896 RepID=UPI0005E12674|nr:ferritin family protein [Anaeromyxobacter sp. PSR-1]GAO04568.1 nigerythrin [Anaeromyxobacter sp. PSR-1]
MRTMAIAVGTCVLLLAGGALGAEPSPTQANLQAAHQRDLDAHARYQAFAAAADREGYPAAATLFRAAARSEQIRAELHAAALRRLGGSVTTAAAAVGTVRDTPFNLRAMLSHESAERFGSYPRAVRQARREGLAEAALGFTLAHAVERELVALYQDAVGRLDQLRAPAEPLHVCRTCGHVARGAQPPETCPVSLSPAEAFERVP